MVPSQFTLGSVYPDQLKRSNSHPPNCRRSLPGTSWRDSRAPPCWSTRSRLPETIPETILGDDSLKASLPCLSPWRRFPGRSCRRPRGILDTVRGPNPRKRSRGGSCILGTVPGPLRAPLLTGGLGGDSGAVLCFPTRVTSGLSRIPTCPRPSLSAVCIGPPTPPPASGSRFS